VRQRVLYKEAQIWRPHVPAPGPTGPAGNPGIEGNPAAESCHNKRI